MMRLIFFLFILSSQLLYGGFEPGGVSFDFGKYPVRKSKRAAGKNLLINGDFSFPRTDLQGEGKRTTTRKGQYWDGCSYVHMSSTDGPRAPFLKEMQKYSFRRVENGSALIITDAKAAATWKKRMRVSNRVRQAVTIPEANTPRSYQLSFKLRGQAGKVDTWNHPQIFINAEGERRKLLKTCVSKSVPFSREFQEYTIDFTVPPATRSIHVDFALYGIGRLYFDDVKLTPITLSGAVEALNFPVGYFDETFHVPSGQPIPMLFALGCQGKPNRKKLRFEIELPPQFYIASWRPDHRMISKKGNLYVFSLERIHPSAIAPGFNRQWQAVSLLAGTHLAPSAKTFTARYRTAGADYTTPWRALKLKVIAPVKGTRPQQFLSGAMLSTDFNYTSHWQKAVKLLSDTGFNAVVNGNSNVKNAVKTFKIRRVSSLGMGNGFNVIRGKLNEDEKFRKIDGTAWKGSICPGTVIRRSATYKKVFLPLLDKAFGPQGDTDTVMCNWEPYMYDFRGCFCRECMTEFAKFAKIPPKESTPLLAISKYKSQWIRFRSMRHGEMVKQLNKDIAAAGKRHGIKDASFIPEMAYNSVLPARKDHYAQYAVKDYIDAIPELNLWGPYIFHAPDRPYVYAPAPNLRSFTAWEQVLHHVNKTVQKKRPKLYTFPHGTLDNPVWFSNPEAIAFEFLATFVLGWEGAFGYYLPRGGDGRYYRAIAQANSLIARHEKLRYAGKEITKDVQLTPVTPFPRNNFFREYPGLPNELPGISKKSLLQYRAVEHKGTRVIMAGNFWISSEVFFNLKLQGLSPASRYEVTVPGVRCGTFSGAELAKGILMQCGALRWQFITVKPSNQKVRPDISQKQLRQMMQTRLPAIKKAAAFCHAEYKKRSATEAGNARIDLSAVKALGSSGIKCAAAGDRINITAPRYSLQIDPRNGGRIVNWQNSGEYLFREPGALGFGVDGFWYPAAAAKQLLKPYRVIRSSKIPGGISVTLEYTITPDFIPPLAGMRLTKSYEFFKDRVAQTTTLANHSEHGMNFSFRFHAMPDFLTLRSSKSGTVDFGGIFFKREFFEKLFRYAAPDNVIEKAFPMHKVQTIRRPEGILSAPWSKLKLKTVFEKEKLQCIVCWDDLKDPGATYEAIFRRTSLHPGDKISYRQEYSVIQ